MKLRFASIAFLAASLSTVIAWLAIQPVFARMMMLAREHGAGSDAGVAFARARAVLPLGLFADFTVSWLLIFCVLHFLVGRPLGAAAREIEAAENLEPEQSLRALGGPIVGRLGRALRQALAALGREREITTRQLAELRRSHETLEKTQVGLVAAEQMAMVGRLSAGVAHEVGNPLAGVMGYLALLEPLVAGTPDASDYVRRIEVEIRRIDGIVRGLTDLGRPLRRNPTPLGLREVVESVRQIVLAMPDFKGTLVIDNAVDAALFARAETGPLSQILLNVLLNAGQAMSGRGRIEVRSRKSGDGRCGIDVLDEGPGFDAATRARLFEPFFTTKHETRGTGLGLAVSRNLARELDGELSADTRSDRPGAIFTLTLPT